MGETQIREEADQLGPAGQPRERGGGRREACLRGQQDEIRLGLGSTEGNLSYHRGIVKPVEDFKRQELTTSERLLE